MTLAEEAANRRARRRANGTCIECDEPPKPEKTLCQKHMDQKSAASVRWRRRNPGRYVGH